MNPKFVLDASAVLALIQRESGWLKVAGLIPEAAISAVNWAEVGAKHGKQRLSVRLVKSGGIQVGQGKRRAGETRDQQDHGNSGFHGQFLIVMRPNY